ncbi:MAG: DUF1501 domain-containing protein, partial [Bacteroidota bacterium]
NDDRVLVLVQLNGGNDGLQTLVPLDQYGNLTQVRSNIILPENSLLNITPTDAFHPRMPGMQELFFEGKLGIVQSVGYPNQNRSHFRSTDIWTSASSADEEITTGWLGRHFEINHPNYPIDYPNAATPHPLAMVMDTVVSATCQGTVSNFSLAVDNPFSYTYISPGGTTPVPENNYGEELTFVRQTIAQSNEYGNLITDLANTGQSLVQYPDTDLGNQLKNIAILLDAGIQTRIFIATLGGFDTHAGQTTGNNTTGAHADLLEDLSKSIAAFQQDLTLLGLDERVLGMTFSEFGRRIRSNTSRGTDHGTAAPLFLFGNCAQGGILGQSPTIDPQVDQSEGVPMQYDFRDIYGSILVDWFGLSTNDVQDLIAPGFTYLPILGGCNFLPVEWLSFRAIARQQDILLEWSTAAEVDNTGFAVERSLDGRSFSRIDFVPSQGNGENVNTYTYLDRSVRKGPLYYYRLQQIDVDGSASYSSIQVARLAGSALGNWQVGLPAPNPVNETTTVQIFAPIDSVANFELFDANGRRLQTGSINLIGGRDNRIPLSGLASLPAGTYVWRVQVGEQMVTRKLVRR